MSDQASFSRRWWHALFALLCAFPLLAGAQSYVGKVCLMSTVTERQAGPVTPPELFAVEVDVTNLGGTMYAIAGAVADLPDQPALVTGIATVIGGEMYMNMTLTQAHTDGWMDTGINRTKLNLATMTGTFYEVGHDFNTVNRTFDNTRYTAGTVSVSSGACQR